MGVEAGLQTTHCYLSWASAPPVLGAIPGAVKIVVGLVEAVVALLFVILSAIPAIFSQTARDFCAKSAEHIGEGLKRAAMGAVLSIPLVGTGVVICIYSIYKIPEDAAAIAEGLEQDRSSKRTVVDIDAKPHYPYLLA